MRAVYALNRRPAAWPASNVAHLVLDGADRALCGVLPGEAAPVVTCRSCAGRWAYQTPQGRAAMHRARNRLVFALAAAATERR